MFESQRKILFKSPLTIIHSRKLDTALRSSTTQAFKKRLMSNSPSIDDRFFLRACEYLDPQIDLYTIKLNNHIWGPILHDNLCGRHFSFDSTHRRVSGLIARNLSIQIKHNIKSIADPRVQPSTEEIQDYLNKPLNFPAEVIGLMQLTLALESSVETLGVGYTSEWLTTEERIEKLAPLCHWKHTGLKLILAWSNQLLYIKYRGVETLVPRDYLLLLHNKAADILSVLVYAHMVDASGLEQGVFRDTVEFLKSMASIVCQFKSKAYHAFKVLEAMGLGLTLIDVDGPTNQRFNQDVLETLRNDQEIDITTTTMYQILVRASIPFRHELMCLTKVLGHPFVDMIAGTEALHKRTTEEKDLDWELILNSVRHAKRNYIKGYLLKEGKWPPCHLLCKSRLSQPWAESRDPDSRHYTDTHGPVPLVAYDTVEILPNLKFRKMENIIPYLKDKTITVVRSKILKKYIERRDDTRIPWEETRLLLYFLFNTMAKTDHIPYLDIWVEEDDINFEQLADYLIIRVVPKEKEMKEAYRGFGCKTYLDRMRALIQEMNTAHYLDLYSPEQAMTLDELDILHKLLNFRRIDRAYKSYTPLYLVIDASGWNNMFRHETVAPIGAEVLDKVFGSKIYERTMLAYEHTMYYVSDHDRVLHWDGQYGGIEGLNQYTWDVVYLAQIRAALEGCGFDPILFAKGDDLRAVILVPPKMLTDQSIDDIRIMLVNAIKEKMQKLGHTINVNESYGSKAYFAFSKAASIGMIEMPQTYRKIQKCYGANNAFLPFLDDYISSSFSNAHSACKTTTNTIACYTVALFWSYFHLTKHPRYQKLSDAELVAALMVPSMLGGFPIIYLHNMWVRAESDLLSPFFDLCRTTLGIDPEVSEILLNFLKLDLIDPQDAFTGLLIDPYSLPIRKPTAASTTLRNLIMPAIRSKIKNEQIRLLVDAAESDEMKAIVQTLYTSNVYSAKLLSAIFASSPQGLIQELTRKFESGRSVLEAIILRWGKYKAARYIRKVLRADNSVHVHRRDVIAGVHRWTDDYSGLVTKCPCPGEAANRIRRETWKKPVEGITMPPVQHQLVLASEYDVSTNVWALQNHFIYAYQRPTQIIAPERDPLPLFTASDTKPFIGFKTRLGMSTPREQLVESDEILDKVKNLIDLLSWVRMHALTVGDLEPNLEQVIYVILSLYIDIDPDRITPFRGKRKSGTVQHHIRAPHFRESIVPNTLSNVYTRFFGSSNTHITLRNSGAHYMVNFLHLYCHAAFLMTIRQQFQNREISGDITCWGITAECDHCTRPITETAIHVDLSLLKGIKFTALRETKLSDRAMEIITESLATTKVKLEREIINPNQLPEKIAQAGIIQELLCSHVMIRERLNDYNYHHVMDEESYEIMSGVAGVHQTRQVSDTELKKIPMNIYFDCLIVHCVEYIYKEFRLNSLETVASWLHQQPAAQFPWEPLLRKVYSIGKLTMLIQYIVRRSGIPAPDIYDSPRSAALYVAHAAYVTYHSGVVEILPLVVMSHYAIHDLERLLVPHFKMLRHRWAKRHLYPLISSHDPNKDFQGTIVLLMAIICFWSCPYQDDEDMDEKLGSIPINTVSYLKLLDLSLHNREFLPTSIEELPACCHAIFRLPPFRDHVQYAIDTLQDIGAFRDAIELLRNLKPDITLNICRTTLPECIATVRQCPTIPAVLASGTIPLHSGLDMPLLRAKADSDRILTIRPTSTYLDYSVHQALDTPVLQLYPTRHLCPWFYHRTIGFGTSAPSKLVYILTSLGADMLPHGAAFASLADGHGGFASTIDKLTYNSRIQFNTLIQQYEAETQPSAWMADESANQIEYESLRSGLSDLTMPHTMRSLETTLPFLLSLVTCDAQTVGMDMVLRERLIWNVVNYYLRKRTENGVLIMKLYFTEYELNFRLLSVLLTYCRIVFLIKPPASGRNVEVYLVAQGSTATYDGGYNLHPRKYPPINVQTTVIKWYQRISNMYFWPTVEEITFDFRKIAESITIHLSQSLALGHLTRVCGITITTKEWDTWLSRRAWEAAFSEITDKIRRSSQDQFKRFVDIEEGHGDPTTWDQYSLAHKRHLVSNLARNAGSYWVLKVRKTSQTATERQSRSEFFKFCGVVDKCSRVIPKEREKFLSWEDPFYDDWNIYRDWLEGVHVMLSLIGYMNERALSF